jgi:hypothetical protein
MKTFENQSELQGDVDIAHAALEVAGDALERINFQVFTAAEGRLAKKAIEAVAVAQKAVEQLVPQDQ